MLNTEYLCSYNKLLEMENFNEKFCDVVVVVIVLRIQVCGFCAPFSIRTVFAIVCRLFVLRNCLLLLLLLLLLLQPLLLFVVVAVSVNISIHIETWMPELILLNDFINFLNMENRDRC